MKPIFTLFTLFFFLIDVSTKRLFEHKLSINETIIVIPEWLQWKLIHNSGMSFGLGAGHTTFIIILQVLVIGLVIYLKWTYKPTSFIEKLSFSLIIAGGLGNLYDRILLGYVIDFISFRWWPAIFNIADIEIRLGMLLLIVSIIKRNPNKTSKTIKVV
ncbi:signal peptidase II [Paenisporosarcina sp. TG-14]|uniref:signal peptidase II n=1 Tax=Paenisporosarcina sp. TG-14 TaxID=1231057 RepID=UPI00037C980E|nr:signal peptidase II [Paenisporosarcina sp. TG-14]